MNYPENKLECSGKDSKKNRNYLDLLGVWVWKSPFSRFKKIKKYALIILATPHIAQDSCLQLDKTVLA